MRRQLLFTVAMAVLAAAPSAQAAGKIKIGLSFSDFATERWRPERDLMTKLLEAKGFEVISQEANHDPKLQNDQISNMVTQGAKVVVVVAEDGDAAAAAVDDVARKGVRVIAYDRLIKSPKIAAYVSFDNTEVGRAQARGILAAKGAGKFVLLGGSPTDNNAHLVRAGQLEVLKPLIDSGKIQIVADQWVENWDAAKARQVMENIITSTGRGFDAVVASNDGTALGALEAMKVAGLAGRVPISGQDATESGCNSIVRGELTVSVLKDVRQLTPLVCELAAKLARGEKDMGLKPFKLAELAGDKKFTGTVPCKFLPIYQVTKENVKKLVVDSGFQPYEGVYKGIANPPAK